MRVAAVVARKNPIVIPANAQGCPGNFPTFRERLLETRRCGAAPFLDLDFRASKKVSHAEARRRGETVERPDLRGSPGSLRSLGARSAPAQICKALQESNALMLLKCATTLRVSASPRANSFGGAQEMFDVLATAPRFDTFPGQPCSKAGTQQPRIPRRMTLMGRIPRCTINRNLE